MTCLVLFALLGGAVFAAPWISPHDPVYQYSGEELYGPRPGFWFGTDDFGRDILSRCLYGARLSLSTGFVAAGLAGVMGTMLGILAGYTGRRTDQILGRLFDTILSFPGLLMGLGVAVMLGKGQYNAAIAAALINMPLIARIARAAVLSEREKEYVQAAIALGAVGTRVMLRHLLPNILPILLVQITLTMADAMIIEAGLSFLGLGSQPPQPSLGNMLRDSREFMYMALWYAVFPGLALSLFLLLVSFISNGLADAFDPRRQMEGEKA